MFERYTERARRVLFFARYEASNYGAVSIESEHLLLAVARESRGLIGRIFAPWKVSLDGIRREVEERVSFTFKERTPTSVELPFSGDVKRVLAYAAEEADQLLHSYIGVEHLLLALLRDEGTLAGSILAAHGLHLRAARNEVVSILNEGVSLQKGGTESALSEGTQSASALSEGAQSALSERMQLAIEAVTRFNARVDQITRLVEQLAHAAPDSPEACDLVERITRELGTLKPPPGGLIWLS